MSIMSTTLNVGTDLKDYLNTRTADKPSLSSNVSNFFSTNKAKEWFYQPLTTEEVDHSINGSLDGNKRQLNNISFVSQMNTTLELIDIPFSSTAAKSWLSSISFSSSAQKESDDWLPSLSRTQRIIGFLAFVLMGLLCFTLSSFYIPVLVFKARKFALLFTMGSLFIVLSFSVLWGPINHLKHLFSKDRLPFTLTYFGSLFTTLYFALKIQSTLLTTIFAIIQVMALIWYVISYLPGGQTGLMFFTKFATKAAAKSLPV